MSHFTREDLRALPQGHDSFVGIDSDGCVFGTMGAKQKDHFHPLIIKHWGLDRCEKELRACAEFVNLRSKNRGTNRFPALLKTFDLFNAYPGVRETGVPLPKTEALRAYVHSDLPLGNPSLKAEVARTHDPELTRLLDWSLAINEDIDRRMKPVPPFRWALKALDLIRTHSDAIVVSQTPEEALIKEWNLHGITDRVALIAGQELGTKAEHIRLATGGRYAADRVLMLGDAPGDCRAAREAGALFYPIMPEDEESSWEKFCTEAYAKFLGGSYAGPYEQALIGAFDASLPEVPPWQRA
jgi:phosphoglycolate phosphatase-like HAD superfamily hydrolase